MRHRVKQDKKAYAMLRMQEAIGRAIDSDTPTEKNRAARWAAAWGAMGGIRSPGLRLRRNVLIDRRRLPR
jgi:hypothetical protein